MASHLTSQKTHSSTTFSYQKSVCESCMKQCQDFLGQAFFHQYLYNNVTDSTPPKYFFPYNYMQFLPRKCLSHQQFHNDELNSNCYSYSWPKLCFRGKNLEQINLIMVPFVGCNKTGGKCKHYAKINYTNTAHSMFTSLKMTLHKIFLIIVSIFTNGCVRNFLTSKSQVGSLHFWDVHGIGWLLVTDISDYKLVPLPLTSLTAHTTKSQYCIIWL